MKINKGKYFTLLLTILIVVILGGVAWKLYPYVLQRIELSRFQSAVETIETINQAIVQASKEHPGKKLKPSMLFVEDTIWEDDHFVYSMNNLLVFACRKNPKFPCDLATNPKAQAQSIYAATGSNIVDAINCVKSGGMLCSFSMFVRPRKNIRKFGKYGAYTIIGFPQGVRSVCENDYDFVCQQLEEDIRANRKKDK